VRSENEGYQAKEMIEQVTSRRAGFSAPNFSKHTQGDIQIPEIIATLLP
jgi:hypothetical protein